MYRIFFVGEEDETCSIDEVDGFHDTVCSNPASYRLERRSDRGIETIDICAEHKEAAKKEGVAI
jgi:hypothetical protein